MATYSEMFHGYGRLQGQHLHGLGGFGSFGHYYAGLGATTAPAPTRSGAVVVRTVDLQGYLNVVVIGGEPMPLAVDGIFGPSTERAFGRFIAEKTSIPSFSVAGRNGGAWAEVYPKVAADLLWNFAGQSAPEAQAPAPRVAVPSTVTTSDTGISPPTPIEDEGGIPAWALVLAGAVAIAASIGVGVVLLRKKGRGSGVGGSVQVITFRGVGGGPASIEQALPIRPWLDEEATRWIGTDGYVITPSPTYTKEETPRGLVYIVEWRGERLSRDRTMVETRHVRRGFSASDTSSIPDPLPEFSSSWQSSGPTWWGEWRRPIIGGLVLVGVAGLTAVGYMIWKKRRR